MIRQSVGQKRKAMWMEKTKKKHENSNNNNGGAMGQSVVGNDEPQKKNEKRTSTKTRQNGMVKCKWRE